MTLRDMIAYAYNVEPDWVRGGEKWLETDRFDINAWYVTNKMSTQKFPAERVVNSTFIDAAIQKLGPFELQNKASKLPGCRD